MSWFHLLVISLLALGLLCVILWSTNSPERPRLERRKRRLRRRAGMSRQRVYTPWPLPASAEVDPVFSGLWGRLTVLVSKDAGNWHLSISHPRRYPTWDEIRDARYEFVPDADVTMAMLLPPRHEYVNVHDTCFHLFEVKP